MSYSEETPNYMLPLYLADDRPSYLGDWNETMNKIDSTMKSNESSSNNNEVAIANLKEYVDNNTKTLNGRMDGIEADVTNKLNNVYTKTQSDERFVKVKSVKNVVIIGDSYCTDDNGRTSIPTQMKTFASDWNILNYSVSGTGFVSTNGTTNFNVQINNAKAGVGNTADIDYVLIIGGRNDIQTASTIKSAAITTIKNAVDSFVNAKVCVFPCLWDWKHPIYSLMEANVAISDAAKENKCFCAKGCYTWGIGDESVYYIGGSDIHPNPAGSLFMAHIIYNAVKYDNADTFRDRNEIHGNLQYSMINGAIYLQGAHGFNVSDSNLIDTVPSWVIPVGKNVYFGVVYSLDDGGANGVQIMQNGKMKKYQGDSPSASLGLCFNHCLPITI